jgi:hypothetical protein
MRKILILAMVILSITCLAGCGGSGGSSSGSGESEVTNTAILALLGKYETAVEAYDVTGMLDCLDSGSFSLTINEGSYSNTKDYGTLITELESDKDCQRAWRKTSGEDAANGHSYKLDLVLGTPTSSNETSTGAVVKQTFQVWESSVEVTPAIETDSGNIVWTLVQNSGEWKATAMTINYDYSTSKSAASAKAGLADGGSNEKGFGFGCISVTLF